MIVDKIEVDDDDDMNVVVEDVNMVEEVILVKVENMVDDKIDVDVVADGEVDDTVDTVEVDIKDDNEGDVAEEVILVEVEDMVDDKIEVDDDDDIKVVVEDVNMVEEVMLVEVEDMVDVVSKVDE